MRLIKTNDGLHGWIMKDKMIWCTTHEELYAIGWANVATRRDPEWKTSFILEVDYALNYMTKHNHTIAEFGVFGSFIYSGKEEEAV